MHLKQAIQRKVAEKDDFFSRTGKGMAMGGLLGAGAGATLYGGHALAGLGKNPGLAMYTVPLAGAYGGAVGGAAGAVIGGIAPNIAAGLYALLNKDKRRDEEEDEELEKTAMQKQALDLGSVLKKLLNADVGAAAKRGARGAKKGVKWIGDTFPSDKKIQRMEAVAERLKNRATKPLHDYRGMDPAYSNWISPEGEVSRIAENMKDTIRRGGMERAHNVFFNPEELKTPNSIRPAYWMTTSDLHSSKNLLAPVYARGMKKPGDTWRPDLRESVRKTLAESVGLPYKSHRGVYNDKLSRAANNTLQYGDFLEKLKGAKLGNKVRLATQIGGSAGAATGIGKVISDAMDKAKEKK